MYMYTSGYHSFVILNCFPNLHQAYKNTRGMEEGPKEFLTKFADIMWLVLPKAETQKIMNIEFDQSFSEVKDDIVAVCNSGPLGSACFAFALKMINADMVSDTIDKVVTTMLKQTTLGDEDCVLVLLSPPLHYIILDEMP